MSRSGYSDDYDAQEVAMWRGQVASAIRGKRGQAFLRDLLAALDDMPEKRLIKNELEADGEVCAIGCLGRARGMDMTGLDPEDYDAVASKFNIAHQLAQETVFMNDEWEWKATPERRWQIMREWVAAQITSAQP